MFGFSKKETPPVNFFHYARDQAGFDQIVAWVRQAKELVIDLTPSGEIQAYAAKADATIDHVYLALMKSRGETSYLVEIASPDAKQIVQDKIGLQVNDLAQAHQQSCPVYFSYGERIRDPKYLIV